MEARVRIRPFLVFWYLVLFWFLNHVTVLPIQTWIFFNLSAHSTLWEWDKMHLILAPFCHDTFSSCLLFTFGLISEHYSEVGREQKTAELFLFTGVVTRIVWNSIWFIPERYFILYLLPLPHEKWELARDSIE